MVRLQKYLADRGVDSRRKCETYIETGRVKVNGEIVTKLGTKVDPEKDEISFDDNILGESQANVYIMLNKPTAYLTTVSDDRGRLTVLDLLKNIDERIFPVGRLDYETEGLLLLTNDGELTYKLTHPKHEVYKSYEAWVEGIPEESDLDKLRQGILLDDKITAPAIIKILQIEDDKSLLEIKIREGRNRQVRRMFEEIEHPVLNLKRTEQAGLKLGTLPLGEYRFLTEQEIEELKTLNN